MYSCRRWLITVIVITSPWRAIAQDVDSLALSGIDDALTLEDSLSIFSMIDSLLLYNDSNSSQLAVRLGYNSNVLSAGRTLGIENFGLSTGISFYHKSGLYADASGYWSKDFDPSYYLTVASVGYMHVFSKVLSIMGGYDRYFYNVNDADQFVPYKNTLSVTPIIELKPFLFSFNYAFYFGDAHVNRIMPGMSMVLQKKKFLGLDRTALSPSFFVLFGDETLTEIDFVPPRSIAEARMNKQLYGTYFSLVDKNSRVFGVMNYTFSAPLMVTYKNWGFSFTYAYSIPKALPGEPLTFSESSYLTGSITYFIDLKRNKLAL